MKFDEIKIEYFDDTYGEVFDIGRETMFEKIKDMNMAQGITFDYKGIKYSFYGGDEYTYCIHDADSEYFRYGKFAQKSELEELLLILEGAFE